MAFRVFQAYSNILARRPLLVQSATAASLYCIGDVIAQKASAVGEKLEWDYNRTLRMTLIGGAAMGPTMAIWYRALQTNIQLSTHTKSVVARVLADQIVFAPTSIAGLYYLTELLQPSTGPVRQRLAVARAKVQDSFASVLVKNYTLWPAVSFLNFFYVPLQYRLLVSNTVAVFWSAYLSLSVNDRELRVDEPMYVA